MLEKNITTLIGANLSTHSGKRRQRLLSSNPKKRKT